MYLRPIYRNLNTNTFPIIILLSVRIIIATNHNIYKMNNILLTLLTIILLFSFAHSATSLCKDYIQAVTTSAMQMNISKIPIATIMYSGITTNNPGQKYECEHKTPISDPYNYFLIGFKNTTNNVNTFTGLCVPSQCTK